MAWGASGAIARISTTGCCTALLSRFCPIRRPFLLCLLASLASWRFTDCPGTKGKGAPGAVSVGVSGAADWSIRCLRCRPVRRGGSLGHSVPYPPATARLRRSSAFVCVPCPLGVRGTATGTVALLSVPEDRAPATARLRANTDHLIFGTYRLGRFSSRSRRAGA